MTGGDEPAGPDTSAGNAGRADPRLMGPADVRRRASELGLRPIKALGQNFVVDANTVRRIVRTARLSRDDVVVEVGPGLGSLTLALLPEVEHVVAIEIDRRLARSARRHGGGVRTGPGRPSRRRSSRRCAGSRAARAGPDRVGRQPALQRRCSGTAAPAGNASHPANGVVMVQQEVADRLAAGPGSRTYGVPSVKVAWYTDVRPAGPVARTVFWPSPNVDSALVALTRHDPPGGADRRDVFAVVDAAFAQRRKTLRAALSRWAGSPAAAEEILWAAGVDPRARGEQLAVGDFVRIAAARTGLPDERQRDE